jgi:DNA-binding transcriptional ArsR family regulator
MSDAPSSSPTGTVTLQRLNPVAVLAALGSKIRWPIVQLLADGTPRTATDVASALKRDFDGVSKHLRLMRDAGVVDAMPGEDRRLLFFFIPGQNRQQPGVLDYGVCTVRVATAKPPPWPKD